MINTKLKRGRKTGGKTKKLCYRLSIKDIINDVWIDKGTYATYRDIATIINYSYDTVRDISLNRNKKLGKFYKIEKI